MLVAWFLPITAGYVLEDVLAIVKLRTGTLEIFPEARGRARGDVLGVSQLFGSDTLW